MASRADAAVVDLLDALCATLFDNLRREIGLIMWRANTGLSCTIIFAGSDSNFSPICSIALAATPVECLFFLSAQDDRGRVWIDNVDRAAVSDMNAEREPRLICNEPSQPAKCLSDPTGPSTIAILFP